MRPSVINTASPLCARHTPPALIALGLVILLCHIACPPLPVATACALIALGASIATVLRFAYRAAVVCHLCVYVGLYTLFVGAICDAGMRASSSGLSIPQIADLGLSAGIMVFVVQMCIAAVVGDRNSSFR